MTLGAMISDMKYRARDRLSGLWGHALVITLIVFLLQLGMSSLGGTVLSAFRAANPALFSQLSLTPGAVILQWPSSFSARELSVLALYFGILAGLALISALIGDPLAVGRAGWYERCVSAEPEGVSHVFTWYESAGRYLKAFWVLLLRRLKIFLWSLLFILPGAVLGALCYILFSMTQMAKFYAFRPLFIFLGCVVVLAALVLLLCACVFLCRYAPAVYLLAKRPELRAREVFRESVRIMKGHRWQLLALNLSFLGWALLVPFTLGLILLYLIPYRRAALSIFFEYVLAVDGHVETPADPLCDIPDAPEDMPLTGELGSAMPALPLRAVPLWEASAPEGDAPAAPPSDTAPTAEFKLFSDESASDRPAAEPTPPENAPAQEAPSQDISAQDAPAQAVPPESAAEQDAPAQDAPPEEPAVGG